MVVQCSVCRKRFAYRCHLVDHTRTHTGEKPFKCDICSAAFSLKSSLYDHAVIHLENREMFKCMLCYFSTHLFEKIERHAAARHNGSLRFLKSAPCANAIERQPRQFKCSRCLLDCRGRIDDIIAHLSTHTGIKPFKCAYCNLAFPRAGTLANHRRRFHGGTNDAIRCQVCGNAFACRANLTAHVQTVHLRAKPYSCDVCPKRFSTAAAARQHRHAHRGERFLKCDLCPKTFLVNTQLRLHKASAHEGFRAYKCCICYTGFTQKAPLIAHLFSVHVGIKAFSCSICCSLFSSSGALGLHRRTQHTSLKHRCEECGKTFKGRRYLKYHIQYHVKGYSCSQCPLKFHTKPQLDKHRSVVHSNSERASEQYKCASCLAVFKSSRNLCSHYKRMHKARKLLHCKCCAKKFTSEGGLRTHWKIAHAPDTPQFACAKCGWVAKMKNTLKIHLRLMHSANQTEHPQINCAQCEAVFYHRTQLFKHFKKVHIPKTTRYGCAICGRVFTRIYRLIDHQRRFSGKFK